MTLQKLASHIAALEGKKSQIQIGNIREAIKCLCMLEAAHRVKKAIEGPSGLDALGIDAYEGPFDALQDRVYDVAVKMYAKETKRRERQLSKSLKKSATIVKGAKT